MYYSGNLFRRASKVCASSAKLAHAKATHPRASNYTKQHTFAKINHLAGDGELLQNIPALAY